MRDTYEVLDLGEPWRGRYLAVREPSLVGDEHRHGCGRSYAGMTEKMIAIDKVILFRSEHKYTVMYHDGGENIVNHTIKELEGLFPTRLLRIHRGVLVNKERVESCEKKSHYRAKVKLAGCREKLPVSRRYAPKLRQLILGYAVRTRAKPAEKPHQAIARA